LKTLLMARNRVSSIQPSIATSIPNLTNLVLTANNLAELADLDTLSKFTKLTHLTLMENPVTRKEHYRYWVVFRCPSVRFLDYQKVKDVERKKAAELFGTVAEPSALASKIMGVKSKTFEVKSLNGAPTTSKTLRIQLSPQERKRVEEMARNAKSLDDIVRLEKELSEGRVPVGAQDLGDAMDES